ncbi:MAG: septum formation protein Maf [Paludibacteraceae bacterium]|nr:septum formation protein Maf [Paludibacteraceae bacterium]
MTEKLKGWKVVLVSQSPRRRELLAGLEIEFTATSIDTDERYPENLSGAQIPTYIAEQKAAAYQPLLHDKQLAITADTVVICNDRVLGKPKTREEAVEMLHALQGNTHKVITGVCLLSLQKTRSFHAISEVTFAPLTDEEIAHYIDRYRPFDKAGSYGVQEWIGFIGIEKLVGSYYNVMGLPTHRLYKELKAFLA